MKDEGYDGSWVLENRIYAHLSDAQAYMLEHHKLYVKEIIADVDASIAAGFQKDDEREKIDINVTEM
jgi:hypothetical protein